MPRIGITGHSNLVDPTTGLVANALHETLAARAGGLVGVTCLARGADQIFARVVLELGGAVDVVLPAADYRVRKVKADNAADFDALIARAATVHTMPAPTSNRDAYLAASAHLLATVDELVAVWDGAPPTGTGSTGDVVRTARERGIPVTVLWPRGAVRE